MGLAIAVAAIVAKRPIYKSLYCIVADLSCFARMKEMAIIRYTATNLNYQRVKLAVFIS